MHNVLKFLKSSMSVPQAYGWFHLMFVAILAITVVLMAIFMKETTEKQNKKVVLAYVVVCLALELYKQIVFAYDVNTRAWDYAWYAFPFQFCSTPMYVALVSLFVKKGKVRDALYSFLSTYGLLAGLLVMIMPGDVFTGTIGINLQTMIHHGGQVFIGAYLLISKKTKLDFKTPLRGLPVFAVLLLIAFVLNVTVVNFIPDTFNMFFIGPHYPNHLPILSIVYANAPYVVFLISYVAGFTVGAYIVSLTAQSCVLIKKITCKKK